MSCFFFFFARARTRPLSPPFHTWTSQRQHTPTQTLSHPSLDAPCQLHTCACAHAPWTTAPLRAPPLCCALGLSFEQCEPISKERCWLVGRERERETEPPDGLGGPLSALTPHTHTHTHPYVWRSSAAVSARRTHAARTHTYTHTHTWCKRAARRARHRPLVAMTVFLCARSAHPPSPLSLFVARPARTRAAFVDTHTTTATTRHSDRALTTPALTLINIAHHTRVWR